MVESSSPYTISPLVWQPSPSNPNTFAKSDYWTILLEAGDYTLDYMSGGHSGEARQLRITQVEAEQLRDGSLSFDELLIRNGAH